MSSVWRGLSLLLSFSGRDGRAQFWPYAGVVFVAVMASSFVLMAWAMSGFWTEVHQFAVTHPEATTITTSPGSYSMQIDGNHPDAPMPDLRSFFVVIGITIILAVTLLASAISRRLHDRNLPAFLGLLPVVFIAIALTSLPVMINDFKTQEEPNFSFIILLFLNNILYLLSLLGLIIILALPGTKGPNRFGDVPGR